MSTPAETPCPSWCADCTRDGDPPGSVLHQGFEHLVGGFGECGEPIPVSVRPVYFDLPEENRQLCTAELTRPYIEVRIPGPIGPVISLTPAQTRALAEALSVCAAAMGTGEPDESQPLRV